MKKNLSMVIVLFWVTACFAGKNHFPEQPYPALDLKSDLEHHVATSDDPFSYPLTEASKKVSITQFGWVTSHKLPEEVRAQRSNNNVSITVFENRLFMAFRTSTTHFASSKTRIYIMSSLNGVDWDFEADVYRETDLREPQLIVMNGQLNFIFFEGGVNPFKFKPTEMLRLTRLSQGHWSEPVPFLEKGEVPWEVKTRQGATYLTSYKGTHYSIKDPSSIDVMFKKTLDGVFFTAADETAASTVVYNGGVSEMGWEFDHEGNVWGVTRDEDGDRNGFGSQLMFAPKDHLKQWKTMAPIDRNCYMSPKMFRVGEELYLIGRRQLGPHPFGRTDFGAPIPWQRINNWVTHSLSAKGTGLYHINKKTFAIELVMDLPGHGDTAFPSIYRISEREFLVANYTSRLDRPNRSWIHGQLAPTEVYLMKLKFE